MPWRTTDKKRRASCDAIKVKLIYNMIWDSTYHLMPSKQGLHLLRQLHHLMHQEKVYLKHHLRQLPHLRPSRQSLPVTSSEIVTSSVATTERPSVFVSIEFLRNFNDPDLGFLLLLVVSSGGWPNISKQFHSYNYSKIRMPGIIYYLTIN